MFSRTLPLANLIACLLFVWLQEPADPWYLQEVDQARQRGAMFDVDDIWGTLACRTLNNWGPIHGGEAIGVAVLEVLNLPSLLLTGFAGVIAESFGAARGTSACRWSWLLAGVFMTLASAQWWIIGHAIDRRGGRLNIHPVWLAYAAAPWGAVPIAAGVQLYWTLADGGPIGGTTLLTSAVVFAYFIGLLLLPVCLVFEKAGWRDWRYYVPTGTGAGLVTAFAFTGGSKATWDAYLVCSLSGMACAIVFSIVLRYRDRLRPVSR